MNKIYTRVIWKNKPSTKSPINETNLNKMDLAIDMLDDEAVQLDTTKADKIEMQPLIKDWKIDEETGIITITRVNGEQILFDLNIEKIPVSFVLSEDGILTMTTDDGTEFTADIGSMIPVLTFESSDTIAVSVSGTGKDKTYSFSIKPASVTEDMLQPNFLADVKVEAGKAAASAQSASQSAQDASESAAAAKDSEDAAGLSAAAASQSEKNASQSATQSQANADATAADKAEVERLAGEVADDLQEVTELATQAGTDAERAETAATAAEKSADTAGEAEKRAKNYSDLSRSYAVGTGNTVRENDDTDNSKYYFEQSKRISQGFTGLIPMGTVTFEQLSELQDPQTGYLYNISNAFTSDETFQGGAGVEYGAGSNVYRTAEGCWDVLAGNAVTGIAIGANGEMKQGNVTVPTATGDAIGLVKPDGDTITVGEDGTLSVADGFVPEIKIATTQAAGIVKPDGKTITVAEDGTITGASTEFTGTTQEYKQAKESGEIADGTIVNITDDYSGGSGGGGSVTVDAELSDASENPVQNKVITEKINELDTLITQANHLKEQLKQVAFSGLYSDLVGTPQIPTVPDALKNPYPLKFTGAVEESYDGSVAKEINIATGGASVPYPRYESYNLNETFFEYSGLSYGSYGPTLGSYAKIEKMNDFVNCFCIEFSSYSTDIGLSKFARIKVKEIFERVFGNCDNLIVFATGLKTKRTFLNKSGEYFEETYNNNFSDSIVKIGYGEYEFAVEYTEHEEYSVTSNYESTNFLTSLYFVVLKTS